MSKFLFHLDGLLRHRKNLERERQRDLAVIAAEMTRLQAELGSLNGTLQETLQDLRTNHLVGKLDVQFLATHRRYILSVQRKSGSIAQNMAMVQKRIDDARGQLIEAARQRKILEKLREKHQQAWVEKQNHSEFLEADDIGTRLALAEQANVGEDAPVKTLGTVIMMFLAINFLALAGGAGYLMQSGHLNKERSKAIREVLFPPATQPTTRPAEIEVPPSPTASSRLEELLAKHTGSRTATEQADFLQHSFDAQMSQLDQRQRQLEDLQHLVAQGQAQVRTDRTQLEADRQKLTDDRQETARLASDQGFQDSLNLYNSMPAKQVKEVFLSIDDDAVVNYLRAMTPRTAAKVLKEFKSPEEMVRVHKLMDRMREAAPTTNPAKEQQ